MTIALGIMCKAPRPGRSKTRLAATLGPDHAAELAGCFLRDVAQTVADVIGTRDGQAYGVYAPAGAENELRSLLPASFRLLLQESGDLGIALREAARALLSNHTGVILINADSPTLPPALLHAALAALDRDDDRVVLGPALDGGYTFIGLKADHPELFVDMPWSTPEVLRITMERIAALGLAAEVLPLWYDVDDLESLLILEGEVAGRAPAFSASGLVGGAARFSAARLAAIGRIRA